MYYLNQKHSTMKNLMIAYFILSGVHLFSQSVLLSGNVSDIDGEPLIGATILEKGTSNGTVSDYNGNYELSVNSGASIMVSYTGFNALEVQVGDMVKLNFVMEQDAEVLDQVLVTGFSGVVGRARKRVESVQSIPESVVALNSDGIKKLGVSNLSDFAEFVPNMKMSESQAVGVNFLVVRGIPQIRNADAPVAFVVDGVTIPDPALLNQELFDLALIEAVKGPQGALYGKNAIAGAINIYSKEPTNAFKNNIQLSGGNGGHYSGQVVSSGALSKDKAYYRISGKYQNFNGLLTNTFLDETPDFSKDLNLRGQVILTPTSKLKVTTTLQYMNTDAGATYYSIDPASIGSGGATFLAGIDPNPTNDNSVIHQDVSGNSDLKNLFGSVNLLYNLGKTKFQSITSYNAVDRNTTGDLDFTEEPFDGFVNVFGLDQGEFNNTKSINQEFRLSSNNSASKLDWSVGGFYQNIERDFFQSDLTFSDDWAVTDYTVNFNTLAFFGFLDYKLTDKLTAAVGLRYDIDNYEQVDRLPVLFGITDEPVVNKKDDNVLQPKLSLSYQATKNALIYANYGRGYRAGGFNAQFTELFDGDYDKELSDNYELGAKTSFWKNRILLNGSVFFSDFQDRQQFIYDLDNFVPGNFNYEKSAIAGFELDSKLRLSKYLDVLLSYGFVDSKIDVGGSTGGMDGTSRDLNVFNGNFTSFIPQNNFNIGLASSFEVSDNASVDLNVNLNGTGKIYWSDSNDEGTSSDGYQLLNARATLNMNDFSFSLWGKNMTDRKYYLEVDPGNGFGWRGRPATFGATLGFDF
jgi:iron complex outermembrane recepter protein